MDNDSYQLFTNHDVIHNVVFLSMFLYRRVYNLLPTDNNKLNFSSI